MTSYGFYVIFLLAFVSVCFANIDTLSKELLDRIEALEKRDMEQSARIEILEHEVLSYNNKFIHLTATNNALQNDLVAKTRMLAAHEDSITDLMKDKELLTSKADQSDKHYEVLEHGIQKMSAVVKEIGRKLAENEKGDGIEDEREQETAEDSEEGGKQETESDTVEKLLNNIIGGSSLPLMKGQLNKSSVKRKLKTRRNGQQDLTRFVRNGRRQEGPVAFHAVSDKKEIDHLGINQNIVFETELLNLGGGYHTQHGLFIAPRHGLYIFSTSVLSFINAHAEFEAAITKNGIILATAYGHGDSGRHDQGSVTVVTQLNLGDEVSVKNMYHADDSIWGGRHTTFMGIMVVEM